MIGNEVHNAQSHSQPRLKQQQLGFATITRNGERNLVYDYRCINVLRGSLIKYFLCCVRLLKG